MLDKYFLRYYDRFISYKEFFTRNNILKERGQKMAKFKNLEAEMVRNSLKNEDIAEKLNITPHTVRRKLNGEIGIAIDEAKKIQKLVNDVSKQDFTVDFLFAE